MQTAYFETTPSLEVLLVFKAELIHVMFCGNSFREWTPTQSTISLHELYCFHPPGSFSITSRAVHTYRAVCTMRMQLFLKMPFFTRMPSYEVTVGVDSHAFNYLIFKAIFFFWILDLTGGLKALGFGPVSLKPGVNATWNRTGMGLSSDSTAIPLLSLLWYNLSSLRVLHSVTVSSSFSLPVRQCLSPFFHPFTTRLLIHSVGLHPAPHLGFLPRSSPVFLPFHLHVLPPPYCLHSFCSSEQGQIQSLPHSHFPHSFCQFWLPAFYPIPYSHCLLPLTSLLHLWIANGQGGGGGVGNGGGSKKSRLLLKNLWIFSCIL